MVRQFGADNSQDMFDGNEQSSILHAILVIGNALYKESAREPINSQIQAPDSQIVKRCRSVGSQSVIVDELQRFVLCC